jgi:hypothetical protein
VACLTANTVCQPGTAFLGAADTSRLPNMPSDHHEYISTVPSLLRNNNTTVIAVVFVRPEQDFATGH